LEFRRVLFRSQPFCTPCADGRPANFRNDLLSSVRMARYTVPPFGAVYCCIRDSTTSLTRKSRGDDAGRAVVVVACARLVHGAGGSNPKEVIEDDRDPGDLADPGVVRPAQGRI